MATHSTEFVLGMIDLTVGLLSLLLHWLIANTRFGQAIKEAEKEADAEGNVWGHYKLTDMMLGVGLAMLLAGSVLIVVAFLAYEKF